MPLNEKINETLILMKKHIDLQQTNRVNKEKMLQLVENYKVARNENREISTYLTRNFRHAEMLVEKRQIDLNVRVKEYTVPYAGQWKDSTPPIWGEDGKNIICHIYDDGTKNKEYYINNSKKLHIKEKRAFLYGIINSKNEDNSKLICPNCGAGSLKEETLNACSYCSTKFNMNDFDDKIASITVSSLGGQKTFRDFLKAVVVTDIILSLAFGISGGLAENKSLLDFLITTIPLLIVLFGFFFLILYMIIGFAVIVPLIIMDSIKQGRTMFIGHNMRRIDEYFSREYFFGIVDHRLNIWLFADKHDPMLEWVNNVSADEKNIVDVDIMQYNKIELREDGDLIYIHVDCDVRFICIKNNAIYQKIKRLNPIFCRKRNVETSLITNFEILNCKNCGASISFLEGGKCNYCNTKINIMDYDWVMVEIR